MKSLESLIPSSVAEAIGSTMLHALWQLSALALVLMLVLAIAPQGAAKLRYWASVCTMGLMFALPMGTFAYLYQPQQEVLARPTLASLPTLSVMATPASVNPPVATVAPQGFVEQVTGFVQGNSYIFFGIWMLGVAIFSIRFMGGCWQVHRLRKRSLEDAPEELIARFSRLLERLGIQRNVGLKFSGAINTPMVIGALKPMVLLPAGLLSGLSMEQVECILIHELAHVRRWDFLVNLLQSTVEILLFFHPAIWWVTRIIRQERENCCDELVISLNSNKVQYARALLNLEVLRQQQPALAMGSQGGDLASRIRRITGGAQPRERKVQSRGLLFGLVVMAFVLLLGSQTPTVVKAAFPFLAEEKADPQPLEDPQDGGKVAAADVSTSTEQASRATGMRFALKLASLLGKVEMHSTGQDSPITKVIMNENGVEIALDFDKHGNVVTATRNGKEVPKEEIGRYQGMADEFFARHSVGPAVDMPPMPPMPNIGAVPPMPAMPPMGDPAAPGFDSKQFEAQMEEFGKQMEAWGENFAKQFESQDWEQYGKDAGRWAEAMAGRTMGAETPEMKEIHKELQRLAQEIETTKDPKRLQSLEAEQEALSARLGELQGDAIETRMGDFSMRMEEWAEKFAAQMEELGTRQADEAERMAADAERMAEEADRMAEQADRSAEEADRAAEQAERAAEEAEREAARAEKSAALIGSELVADGLISNRDSYKVKLNNKEFLVNGKQQPDALHRKYKRLLEEHMALKVGKDWVIIQHNAR